MKFSATISLLLMTSLSFGAQLENCSRKIQDKVSTAYSCTYDAPNGCNLKVTESGKKSAAIVYGIIAEAKKEYTCDEYDSTGSFLLVVLQKN